MLVPGVAASSDEETGGGAIPDHDVSPAAALFARARDPGQVASNQIDRALLPGEPGTIGIEDAMTALSKSGIGVIGDDGKSKEIGREFPVTRERIRRIEAKALRRLKHHSRAHVTRSFVEP